MHKLQPKVDQLNVYNRQETDEADKAFDDLYTQLKTELGLRLMYDPHNTEYFIGPPSEPSPWLDAFTKGA